jgi:hypothetical protein
MCINIISGQPSHHSLMMEAEMASETLRFYQQLTRLVTREDFIEFSRRENFKSYKTSSCQITRHLSWTPSEATYRNEECPEYVERTGNIDSSTSGDSVHLILNQ